MGFKTDIFLNNNPPSLDDDNLNGKREELNNTYIASGQTPDNGDLTQTAKAMSIHSAGADFYTDSGAADAYVLTASGSFIPPIAYFVGMRIRFVPINDNTGASTINVASLGIKNIKDFSGNDPEDGYISTESVVELYYDGTNFVITSNSLKASTQSGITASTIQSQGEGPLTAILNRIQIVANNKDTNTLPQPKAGKTCIVINDGANILQLYPPVGKDLGRGVDLPDYLAQKEIVTYKAYDSFTWFPIKTPTPWQTYTPITSGFGTISSIDMSWRKVGNTIEVRGEFQSGTTAASEAQVGLPSGWVCAANSSTTPEIAGMGTQNASGDSFGIALATVGDTYVNYGRIDVSQPTNKLIPQNAINICGNNTTFQNRFDVAVTAA
jgi:hypothetical protein